jgi:hypothetical protein
MTIKDVISTKRKELKNVYTSSKKYISMKINEKSEGYEEFSSLGNDLDEGKHS